MSVNAVTKHISRPAVKEMPRADNKGAILVDLLTSSKDANGWPSSNREPESRILSEGLSAGRRCPSYRLCFGFLAFSVRLLLRGATIRGAIGALGLLIFVENVECFVDLLTQFIVVIDSRFVSTEGGQVYEEGLTMTSALDCPSPEAYQ